MGDIGMIITGASAICSLGLTREASVEAMRRGADCISEKPAPDWAPFEMMTGAWVSGFKPAPVIPAMKARRMDRSAQMAIVVADRALRGADWAVEHGGDDSLGIFVGSGFCGTHSSLSIVHTIFEQGPEQVSAAAFPNTVPNAPAGQLAIHFGIEGPSATLLQTGSTAEAALLYGSEQLRRRECRAVLWGGVDETTEYLWYGWRRLGWVGENSADRVHGRPLHPNSRGFLAGEAAAIMVIEPEAAARERNAAPLATIELATTAAVESEPWAYPTNSQIGPTAEFFSKSLDACGGPPDLVLGCANGHPRLDRFEANVLERVIGDQVPVWYPKAQVGESMASAALRAVLAIWLIEEGLVPGNFWLWDVKQKLAFNVPVEPLERPICRVFIPTISAGGTLGALVIGALS